MVDRSHSLVLAALAVVAGCGGAPNAAAPTPAPTPQPVELPPPAKADAPTEMPPSQDPCRGRAPCSVDQRHLAGRSAAGHAMTVLEVSLGQSRDEHDPVRACEKREAWLVHGGPGAPPPRLLLAICNDGYGASGVGEDTIEVSDNLFVHSRLGGSAWRWQVTTSLRLDPPAVLSESWGGWWAISDAHDAESSADYVDFRAQSTLEVPRCDAGGELPHGPDLEVIEVSSQPVPSLALPTRLVSDAVAEVAGVRFAACALRMTHADGPADLRVAAVIDAPSKTLFVEVEDDAPSAGDRLSVWTAEDAVQAGMHCAKPRPRHHFALDAQGRFVGKPTSTIAARIEVAPSADGRRRLYRITLASLPEAMTLGYVDADPNEQPVTLASSPVEAHPGDAVGLGRVRPVPETRAQCVLDGEVLVPRLADPPPRTQALVGG